MSLWSWLTSPLRDTPSGFVKKDLTKGVSAIPPLSILSVRSNSLLGKAIRISEKDTEGGDDWPNHTALYMGSGKHEVLEALIKGFVKDTIEDSMNKDTQFKVFVKTDLSVADMVSIKNDAYSLVGTKYDIKGLLSFLVPSIFKPSADADWCSEIVCRIFLSGNIKTSNKEPQKTSPADIQTYLESDEGVANGWVLFDSFNC